MYIFNYVFRNSTSLLYMKWFWCVFMLTLPIGTRSSWQQASEGTGHERNSWAEAQGISREYQTGQTLWEENAGQFLCCSQLYISCLSSLVIFFLMRSTVNLFCLLMFSFSCYAFVIICLCFFISEVSRKWCTNKFILCCQKVIQGRSRIARKGAYILGNHLWVWVTILFF